MTKDKDWQAYAEESQQNAAIQRQQLLVKLEKYRKKGWEQEVLHYGIPFRENQRTLEQIAHHVRRIERAHREHIKENESLITLSYRDKRERDNPASKRNT
jgi:hypothetical protein